MLHAPPRRDTRAAFPGPPATDAPPAAPANPPASGGRTNPLPLAASDLTFGKNPLNPSPMPSSRLSTKGQLVIPQEIRGLLGVRPGDRIDFVVAEDGTVTLRPALLDVRDLRGLLRREGAEPVSVEAMNEAIRLRHGGS